MNESSSVLTPLASRTKPLLLVAGVLALAVLFFLVSRFPGRQGEIVPRFLADLPEPDEDAPYAVIDARRGEFPLEAVRVFADGLTLPSGSSPVSAILPSLDEAEETALVVAERENGVYMYGAFSLNEPEMEALRSMTVPRAWRARLAGAAIVPMETGQGACQISALNISSPLYLEVDGEKGAAYVSDSLFDMERMREARAGRAPGISRGWTDYWDWGGHMRVSDGGLAEEIFSAGGRRRGGIRNAVTAEIRWNSAKPASRGRTLAETVLGGRAEWSVSGLEAVAGRTFLASLKPHDWSKHTPFIPEPPILSFGFNLPDPGRNIEELPAPLRAVASQLSRMRLKPGEVKGILTGPFALSLGGRTQVLWFDLPGLVLDLPGRGDAANSLIDRFWAETFLGAVPKPIDGCAYGGAIDLPFTVMAASDGETTVIGLMTPDVERSAELPEILRGVTDGVGWFFVDLPKLGSAIADMPTFSAILNDEEGLPLDEDATLSLRESMTRMGRLFVSFESAAAGHALWYD
jgi:hypothetical protein